MDHLKMNIKQARALKGLLTKLDGDKRKLDDWTGINLNRMEDRVNLSAPIGDDKYFNYDILPSGEVIKVH